MDWFFGTGDDFCFWGNYIFLQLRLPYNDNTLACNLQVPSPRPAAHVAAAGAQPASVLCYPGTQVILQGRQLRQHPAPHRDRLHRLPVAQTLPQLLCPRLRLQSKLLWTARLV